MRFIGYTDGTCPFNNKRYFDCPPGQGYYILESSFNNSYKIIQKKTENNKINGSDDEFNSAELVYNLYSLYKTIYNF